MATMPNALPDLGRYPVVVSLPVAEPDDLIAACEVMWQEGLRTWSVPVGHLDLLPVLQGLFGRRAVIGVHGATTAAQGAAAVASGARFVAASWVVRGLVKATGDVPVILGGLTPSEIAAAAGAGAAAVQVVPADAAGPTYAQELPAMFPGVALIATGDLGRDEAEQWLAGGALGVWTTGLASAGAVAGPDLDGLRCECQEWRLGRD